MQKSVCFGGVDIALASIMITLSACRPQGDGQPHNVVLQNDAVATPLPSLPAVEPPLDRAAILLAVDRAASAAALGRDDRAEQAKLDGKRIEVRIRFGCVADPAEVADAPFQVRFSEADRTLRLRAVPDLTSKDETIARSASEVDPIEQIEGFWIPRPWLLDAACPVSLLSDAQVQQSKSAKVGTSTAKDEKPRVEASTVEQPQTTMPGAPSVGIAQYFTRQDSRLSRRDGRPYETTKVLDADEQPSGIGYNLVLAGRLRALPKGQVVGCRLTSVNLRPVCIAFAQIDSVRIERPDSGAILAEWSRQ